MFVKLRDGSLLNTDNVRTIEPYVPVGMKSQFNTAVKFADGEIPKICLETVDELHEAIRAETVYLHQLTHNS